MPLVIVETTPSTETLLEWDRGYWGDDTMSRDAIVTHHETSPGQYTAYLYDLYTEKYAGYAGYHIQGQAETPHVVLDRLVSPQQPGQSIEAWLSFIGAESLPVHVYVPTEGPLVPGPELWALYQQFGFVVSEVQWAADWSRVTGLLMVRPATVVVMAAAVATALPAPEHTNGAQEPAIAAQAALFEHKTAEETEVAQLAARKKRANKFQIVMREFYKGRLKTSTGQRLHNQPKHLKQALAIAYAAQKRSDKRKRPTTKKKKKPASNKRAKVTMKAPSTKQ